MTALLIIIFFGVIFAAGFSWLMTVESTNTDQPKPKKTVFGPPAFINPTTGLPMVGGVDSVGNLLGD
jgi:hypothetical protein